MCEITLWPRVEDVNDRFLRAVKTGLKLKNQSLAYRSFFEITAASELMAIVGLGNGADVASYLADLRKRISRIILARSTENSYIRVGDLRIEGAILSLLRDAFLPNFMQTSEGTPAMIHAGPFANIAHGCSSIMADQLGLRLADYVVTEAGFGADLGGEKFFNIKCRTSGLRPDAVVLVSTLKSLYEYGTPVGSSTPEAADARRSVLRRGLKMLAHHIKNMRSFGPPAILVLNQFPDDRPEELSHVLQFARDCGVHGATTHRAFVDGSEGALDLADQIIDATKGTPAPIRYSYELTDTPEEKLRKLARNFYTACDVKIDPQVTEALKHISQDEVLARMPICVAKPPFNLGASAKEKCVPGENPDYLFPIERVKIQAGSGFLRFEASAVETMPGLPKVPKALNFDLDDKGNICY